MQRRKTVTLTAHSTGPRDSGTSTGSTRGPMCAGARPTGPAADRRATRRRRTAIETADAPSRVGAHTGHAALCADGLPASGQTSHARRPRNAPFSARDEALLTQGKPRARDPSPSIAAGVDPQLVPHAPCQRAECNPICQESSAALCTEGCQKRRRRRARGGGWGRVVTAPAPPPPAGAARRRGHRLPYA